MDLHTENFWPFSVIPIWLVPFPTVGVCGCVSVRPDMLRINCTLRKTEQNSPSSLHTLLSIISLSPRRTFIFTGHFFFTRVKSTVWVPLFPE